MSTLYYKGGFVAPPQENMNKGQPQMQPPGPGPVAPQGQTVIVQYVNAPNFGHNPVSP